MIFAILDRNTRNATQTTLRRFSGYTKINASNRRKWADPWIYRYRLVVKGWVSLCCEHLPRTRWLSSLLKNRVDEYVHKKGYLRYKMKPVVFFGWQLFVVVLGFDAAGAIAFCWCLDVDASNNATMSSVTIAKGVIYRSLVSIATPFLDLLRSRWCEEVYSEAVGRITKFKTTIDQKWTFAISTIIIANDPSLSGAIRFILFMILTPFAVGLSRIIVWPSGHREHNRGTHRYDAFVRGVVSRNIAAQIVSANAAFLPMKHNPGSTITADMADMPLVGHVF